MEEYNLDKRVEIKGMWSLPENPDDKVAGILYYVPNESLKLELIGSFGGRNDFKIIEDETSVIYGEGSDAQKITLFNCYPAISFNFSCSFKLTKYTCEYCLIGIHIDHLNTLGKYELHAKIRELTFWCQPKVLTQYFLNAKEGTGSKVCVGFDPNQDHMISSVVVDDGVIISLKGCVKYVGLAFCPQIEQYTELQVSSGSELSIKSLLMYLYKYESFLSFATMNKVKAFQIDFYNGDLYQEISDGRKSYKRISFLHPFKERIALDNKKISLNDFLFDYDFVKKIYPQILVKWYAESLDLAPIREHLIKSIEKKSFYDSTDFIIVIQAIEGFWWRFRDDDYKKRMKSRSEKTNDNNKRLKETSLKILINELLKEFKDVLKIASLNIDVEAVVDSRHYYSHFLKRDKKPKKQDGEDLYSTTAKLRILLICCLLSFIGFNHEQIDSIMKKKEI